MKFDNFNAFKQKKTDIYYTPMVKWSILTAYNACPLWYIELL